MQRMPFSGVDSSAISSEALLRELKGDEPIEKNAVSTIFGQLRLVIRS
jgi:hypothetical protein